MESLVQSILAKLLNDPRADNLTGDDKTIVIGIRAEVPKERILIEPEPINVSNEVKNIVGQKTAPDSLQIPERPSTSPTAFDRPHNLKAVRRSLRGLISLY